MNPDNVWEHWEFSKELADSGQLDPYVHASFRHAPRGRDAVAVVTTPRPSSPATRACLSPAAWSRWRASAAAMAGGVLPPPGTVDVMSSYTRDGERIEHDPQEGVSSSWARPTTMAPTASPVPRSRRDPRLRRPVPALPLRGLELNVSSRRRACAECHRQPERNHRRRGRRGEDRPACRRPARR